MPNVPNSPGVPILAAYGAVADILLLTADLVSIFPGVLLPQWGIFLNGLPVVSADTVVTFEFRQEYSVVEYPLEQGGFESYNKVAHPFDIKVRYAAGGSQSNRAALLNSLASIIGDLNLYDVVTPEFIYPSCNVVHYDYRRSNTNGAGLIVADVWLKQIQIAASSQFTNTAQPSGANPVGNGNTNAIAPTAAQQNNVSGYNIGAGNGT